MKKSYFLIIPILFLVFLVFTKKAEAADEHIVINEIYPNPSGIESDNIEWLELYNQTGNEIILDNFSVHFNSYELSLTGKKIAGNGYLVLQHGNDLNFSLSNTEAVVQLLFNQEVIVDSVSYGNKPDYAPVPGKGKSISRVPNGSDSDNDLNDFKVTTSTKGLPYEKQIYSSDIIISEIMPAPANGVANEFIELYNSGSVAIDLADWQLDDIEGGSAPYSISSQLLIGPGEYRTFYNPETDISLNDDGDSARLIDPNGEVKSMILYDKAVNGESYSKIGEDWKWSDTLTPNAPNVLTVVSDTNQTEIWQGTISEARNEEDGAVVMVRGIVTVLPGVLSNQYFYIQDEISGVQIYSYYKDFPDLQVGDEIEVTGTLSETSGERRIKLDQIPAISLIRKSAPMKPEDLPIEQIDESKEGRYVHVSGQVKETSGDTFYVQSSNSDSSVKVIIKESTGIDKPKMRKGDSVEISGIVSQYKDEYRILPIAQDDVKVIASGNLPLAGPELNYFVLSAIIFTIWNLLVIVKKRLRNLPRKLLRKARAAIFTLCKAIWEAAKLFLPKTLRPVWA